MTRIDLSSALAAIDEHSERTNAFVLVDTEGARAADQAIAQEKAQGVDRGPLHGMTIAVKDIIDIAGQPTTAASRVRATHIAATDAPVITRLREAGAILIGKTNLHEFALGPTSDESAFGPVLNPYDATRVAGGSSGGSAVAVATGMSEAALGTDTGGSIRIPSAACGIVGLKPSLGEVSTEGVVPLSKTFDHVGPMTKNVADAAALWAVLTGRATPTLDAPAANTLSFGELGAYFTALLDRDVRTAFEGALTSLRNAGVSLAPRTVEHASKTGETYASISLPEAAHWHAATLAERPQDYQDIVRQRLQFGATVPAVRYLEAFDMRATLFQEVEAALAGVDALVLPTIPIVAPVLGVSDIVFDLPDGGHETLGVRPAMLRLTQLFNVTGHPAISLPVPAKGLPVGLQLVGRRDQTERLLAIAATCERIFAGAAGGPGSVSSPSYSTSAA